MSLLPCRGNLQAELGLSFTRRFLAVLIPLLLLCPFAVLAQDSDSPEARGAWVLDTKMTASSLEPTIRRLAESGFNIAYVRTWYRGATIYPSEVVEAAGGPRQHTVFAGRDPLAEAIEVGERYGVQIAAWMEYGLVAHTSYATQDDPGPILKANPDWSMVDVQGRIGTQPPVTGGLRFYWMDPAHPEVIDFLSDMAAELAARYPDLAIYEADRFRYPSTQWSYSDVAIERYMQETGNRNPKEVSPGDPELDHWTAWRRAQTTHLMGSVYRAVKGANPGVAVSAAVVPPYMIDTSQDKLQYWPAWADSGYVDFLEPMLYLSDSAFPVQLAQAQALLRGNFPLYAGINADPAITANDPIYQIEESRRQGTRGVVLWYEGAISESDFARLAAGPFATRVNPTHDDRVVDDADADRFTWTGSSTPLPEGYNGGSIALSPAADQSAAWEVSLMRSGHYDIYLHWLPRPENTAEARYRLYVNDELEATYPVDQRAGSGWQHVEHRYFDYNDRVRLELSGGSDGPVVADAVRLLRVAPFRATEALAANAEEIQVRFNYAISAAALSAAAFDMPGTEILEAQLSAADERIVLLRTTPLSAGADYDLTIQNLTDADGRSLVSSTLKLRFQPEAREKLVENDEAGFKADGSWTTHSGDGLDGSSYVTSTGGVKVNRARWLTQTDVEGLYEVSVYLPPGNEQRTASAGYVVGHTAGFDTVYVDQRQEGGWASLGVHRYAAGATGFVQLTGGLTAEGEMAADAARWRRTLFTVSTEAPPLAAAYLMDPPYPNPAVSETTIAFDLDRAASVELQLFDLLGRQVMATAQLPFGPGRHSVRLDLSELPSGIHFVRLIRSTPGGAPDHVETRAVTVVR